jgi:hypothetical protein
MGTFILLLIGALVVAGLAISGTIAVALAVVVVAVAIIAAVLALMGAAFALAFKIALVVIVAVIVQAVCHKLMQMIGSRGNIPALYEEPLSGRIAWIVSALLVGYFGLIR